MRTRKYKKSRLPHRVFLVICEGETEESYINVLKRHYRLPVTIKTKVAGNSINSRLVNQYIKEIGVSPEECNVFYIYDADVKPVLEKIMSLPGTAIISNPCIELWFTLHMRQCIRPLKSETVVKELCALHPSWKAYLKGNFNKDQILHLISNKEIAVSRAKKLEWPSNPSSNMYLFIEALEAEKR